jgi:hypothetical protein
MFVPLVFPPGLLLMRQVSIPRAHTSRRLHPYPAPFRERSVFFPKQHQNHHLSRDLSTPLQFYSISLLRRSQYTVSKIFWRMSQQILTSAITSFIVGNLNALSISRLYSVRDWYNWWIRKDLRGSGLGVIEILPRHSLDGLRKIMETSGGASCSILRR